MRPSSDMVVRCIWLSCAVLILSVGLWLVGAAPLLAADSQSEQSRDDPVPPAGSEQTDRTGTASADSATALADSTDASRLEAEVTQPDYLQQTESSGPLLVSWNWEPQTGVNAQVRKINYWGELSTRMQLAQNSTMSARASYSWDTYRKQDKTTENRDASFAHNTGQQLPVLVNMNLSWHTLEDETVNNANVTNINKNDTKLGTVALNKPNINTGAIQHSWLVNGSIRNQKGESQNNRIDSQESFYSGGWRTKTSVFDGVAFATGLWGQKGKGMGALGTETSPISTDEDSVRVGMYYRRGLVHGFVNIRRSNFVRRYLDFNRNTAGLIDTTTPGVQKIVDELEEKDALSYEWGNNMQVGRFGARFTLARDTGLHGYQASGVGDRERLQDRITTEFSWRYTSADSVSFSYGYLWKWDDQRVKGATETRGKQIQQDRDLSISVKQRLFQGTKLDFKFAQGLKQSIAEKRFNENDRDRLETHASLRIARDWQNTLRVNMLVSYRQIKDFNIRESRSANNNVKETYEVSPGYNLPLAPWLTLTQNFLISIQFTDYVFGYLDEISRENSYNKRGTLNTRVTVKPSQRLTLGVNHDVNLRSNATQTQTDVTGNEFYRVDLRQRISTIDLDLRYEVSPWLTLEGATFRTKDVKDTFGGSSRNTFNYSGEIWVGAVVNKSWGRSNPLTLSGRAKKNHAYGPNVQETNREYWDANLTLSWKF